MQKPLVIAYHLIWTAYGTWLPNDPRGSGSSAVACDILKDLGDLHYGRKTVQPPGDEIHKFYVLAHERLKFRILQFDHEDQVMIASAIGSVVEENRYTCYACVVMPDHVHILMRKHRDSCERMVEELQAATRTALLSRKRLGDHPVWTGGLGWRVFIDHPDTVRRTVQYIADNPVKIGRPLQKWSFVTTYDGWPLHAGHSPQSPYAQRLKAAGRYPRDWKC